MLDWLLDVPVLSQTPLLKFIAKHFNLSSELMDRSNDIKNPIKPVISGSVLLISVFFSRHFQALAIYLWAFEAT